MAKRIIISEKKLTELFGIAERTIRESYKEVKVENAKYDLIEFIKKYVSLQEKKSSNEDLVEAEKELKKSRKDLNEARLKIINKEYLPVDELEEGISSMIFNFKNKLLSLPKKIVVDLEKNKTGNKEKIIETQILKVLNELKEYDNEE